MFGFDFISDRLERIARVFFFTALIIGLAASVIAAIAVGDFVDDFFWTEAGGILAGIGTFAVSVFLSVLNAKIGAYVLFGLGELIENTNANRQAPVPARHPDHAQTDMTDHGKSKEWICPNCGAENDNGSLFCCKCGGSKQ